MGTDQLSVYSIHCQCPVLRNFFGRFRINCCSSFVFFAQMCLILFIVGIDSDIKVKLISVISPYIFYLPVDRRLAVFLQKAVGLAEMAASEESTVCG